MMTERAVEEVWKGKNGKLKVYKLSQRCFGRINLKREELEAGKTHKRPMLDSNVAYVRERSKRIEIASLWVSSLAPTQKRKSVCYYHASVPTQS